MKIYRNPKQPYADPFKASKEIRANEVVKSARLWVDVTQTEIARRTGVNQ